MSLNNHYKLKDFSGDFSTLLKYLNSLDKSFNPLLSTYIDIEQYARKLFEKAEIRLIEKEGQFIGLYAIYFNRNDFPPFTYISLIGVLNQYKGKGAAQLLLEDIVSYSLKENILEIRLEVRIDNEIAVRFYQKNNFMKHSIDEAINNSFYMSKKLVEDVFW
ncbi:MAG: GNAT family N-acetyltransferase [Dysgonomonas sp.]|nr:GNAT family N-acetyltransferase [Dysgonomonas sp.]